MERTIYKYEIPLSPLPSKFSIDIPKGAEVLTAQLQNGVPQLWALVSPDNEKEERNFEIFGTGHDVPVGMGIERKYISTYQAIEGLLVFHFFERIN